MYILKNKLFKFVFVCLFGFIALSNAYATDYYPANTEEAGMCIREKLGVDTGISTAIKALWCPEITTNADGTSITLDATVLGTCSYTTTCSAGYHIKGEANTVKTKVETTLSNSIESESSVVLTAGCVKQEITCSDGTYLETGDITSSSSCATCPAGSYCPGGTFTYTGSAQGKIACPAGTSAGTGRAQCALCSAGTTSSVGANTCTTCPNAQNVASSNGWVEPSLSDTSWTLSHTPTVNHLCEVNNCAEKYAYSVENHSGKNLFDKSQTKITTLSSMLSAQKPAYVAANVYTGVDSDSEIGSTTSWISTNGEGIMIDYTPGDSFYVYFFNGGVPTSNARYAWTLLDADGKALVIRSSYMPGSIITPTAVEGARYFLVQWATGPSNITNYQNIIDGLMITKNQTATEYEPYSASAYKNVCNVCPAGNYCRGDKNPSKVCPIGSYSGDNASTCTECDNDKTTDHEGATTINDCQLCSNSTGASTWADNDFDETTGTMSNLCTISGCSSGYAYGEFTNKVSNSPNLISSPIAQTKSLNGVTITCDGAGVYTLSGTAAADTTILFDINEFTIPTSISAGGTGSFCAYNSAISDKTKLLFYNNSTSVYSWALSAANKFSSAYTQMGGRTTNKVGFFINSGATVNFTVKPAIYNDSRTSAGTFVTGNGTLTTTGATNFQNTCTICPAGSICSGGTSGVSSCSVGNFASTTGGTTCTPCASASYAATTGNIGCTACQGGVATTSTGRSSCDTKCSNNSGFVATWTTATWSTNNTVSNSCTVTDCSAGAYYDASASNGSCTACPTGSYKATSGHTEISCDLCDSGKTSSMGATASSQCKACPNAVGVPTGAWVLPSWNETTKTVDNKCSLTGCSPTYKYNNKMLPDGYTQLEYIESTGTQYIDTGIYGTEKHGLEIKYSYPRLNSSYSGRLCGVRTGAGAANAYAYIGTGSGTLRDSERYYVSSNNGTVWDSSKALDTSIHIASVNILNDNKSYFDGQQIITGLTTPYTHTVTTNIFRAYNGSSYAVPTVARVYYCRLTNNGTLVRNFIPAKRNSDSAIGMYDTVSGQFFTNNGTGSFTAPTTTVTQGASSDYQNICSVCVAGNYCPGGIGNDAAKQEECAVGSWSDDGASKCETCTPGKTTRGTGTAGTSNAICEENCPGADDAHFNADWKSVNWSANTVTNLCKFNRCVVGYHVTAGNYSSSNYSSDATADTCDANTIYIDWNENGGTAITPNGTCVYDGTITFPESTTKTDYRFNGWAL